MKAHVWVMPKRTVLDPQGQTIHHALSGLELPSREGRPPGASSSSSTWMAGVAMRRKRNMERISKEVLSSIRPSRNTASRSSTNGTGSSDRPGSRARSGLRLTCSAGRNSDEIFA